MLGTVEELRRKQASKPAQDPRSAWTRELRTSRTPSQANRIDDRRDTRPNEVPREDTRVLNRQTVDEKEDEIGVEGRRGEREEEARKKGREGEAKGRRRGGENGENKIRRGRRWESTTKIDVDSDETVLECWASRKKDGNGLRGVACEDGAGKRGHARDMFVFRCYIKQRGSCNVMSVRENSLNAHSGIIKHQDLLRIVLHGYLWGSTR